MTAIRPRRRPSRRGWADRWAPLLRGASVAVVVAGVVSVLLTRGWQHSLSRQRDERLDRTRTARTASI